MGSVTQALERITGRTCFETYRRCLDKERLSLLEYDYCDQVFMAQPPKVECRFGKTKSSFLFQSRTDDAGRIIVEIIFPEKGYSGDGKEGMSMDFCKKIEANLSDVFKIRRKENKKPEEFMREILNLSQKMIREKINESGQYKVRSSNPNTRERKEKE